MLSILHTCGHTADHDVDHGERREALLRAGDQLAFGVQHRFVLEGPPALPTSLAGHSAQRYPEDVDAPPVPAARGWAPRVPWLLVAAILLGAALSGLLLFGAR